MTAFCQDPPASDARLFAADLSARIHGVLSFATGHLRELDRYAAFWHDRSDELVRKQDKLVAETVMLLLVSKRAGLADDDSWQELVTHCARWCRSDRVRYSLARHPKAVTSLGTGHLLLSALGYPDEPLDKIVAGALDTGQVEPHERVPFRQLEQHWLAWQVPPDKFERPVCGSLPPWDPRMSILAVDHLGIYAGREDCYALTHTLMYATDFGKRQLTGIDPVAVRSAVASAICFALVIGDFDVLGELLLADAVIPGNASSAAHCGWALRTSVLSGRGTLPDPSFRQDEYDGTSGEERRAYRFLHQYHVEYVDALLCAVLLARGSTWPGGAVEPESAGRTLDVQHVVDIAWPPRTADTSSAVVEQLRALPVRPDRLAETVWETAVVATVLRYDLRALLRLLREFRDTPAESSKGYRTAARFLSNQAALL
ncbi:hypothetical protein GCM10010222_49430 [Streptomyces tanashiensis]|uniref:DUF6895 family protein n=1 Tax=Streptomyces tanashiensis TaxID=67367 RepID=UPI0016768C53|nr:hypothetical protein [Streptomyces tanashiensis]GGT01842.1 hypothetical protein GCM10010222_49430 [Streptomyces tanashiensis]